MFNVNSTLKKTEECQELNLNLILNKTEAGKELICYYEERSNFMPEHRKALVGLIVDFLTTTLRKRASRSKIGDLSGQIALLFSNEEKVAKHKKFTSLLF